MCVKVCLHVLTIEEILCFYKIFFMESFKFITDV